MTTGRAGAPDARPPVSADLVRRAVLESGFDLVGVARVEPLDVGCLRAWLEGGRAAGMSGWMERSLPARADPTQLLAGARSIVVTALAYGRPSEGPIAGYARGTDYHWLHGEAQKRLAERLSRLVPGMRARGGADAWPVMEKVWAERAGLGFIGRNGLLTTERHGSWLTLGAMLLDRDLDGYDAPARGACGGCTACIDACPTRALVGDGSVDARRCIAYLTIESRGRVPPEMRAACSGRLLGCDACQLACPRNSAARTAGQRHPTGALFEASLDLVGVARLSRERHRELVQGTAAARAGYDGLRCNALLALGAAPEARAIEAATTLLGDPSASVRAAAAWLIGQRRL